MAEFYAYNLQNQKLNSDELRTILKFCSDNYAGCISDETPLSITEGTATTKLTGSCNFLVDGFLFHADFNNETATLNDTNNFYGIVINLGNIKSNANISTNEINSSVRIGFIKEFTITQNSAGIYTITRGNEGWNPYKYDTQYFSSLTVGNDTFNGDLVVIPLAVYINSEAKSILGVRTKSSLEEFLTESALNTLLNQLRDEFNSRFVWKEGGKEEQHRGDIGNLNITDNTIKDTNGNGITLDTQTFNISSFNAGAIIKQENKLVSGIVPVEFGGTGASKKDPARKNLGISSGLTLPTTGELGDIFLKIIN